MNAKKKADSQAAELANIAISDEEGPNYTQAAQERLEAEREAVPKDFKLMAQTRELRVSGWGDRGGKWRAAPKACGCRPPAPPGKPANTRTCQ